METYSLIHSDQLETPLLGNDRLNKDEDAAITKERGDSGTSIQITEFSDLSYQTTDDSPLPLDPCSPTYHRKPPLFGRLYAFFATIRPTKQRRRSSSVIAEPFEEHYEETRVQPYSDTNNGN